MRNMEGFNRLNETIISRQAEGRLGALGVSFEIHQCVEIYQANQTLDTRIPILDSDSLPSDIGHDFPGCCYSRRARNRLWRGSEKHGVARRSRAAFRRFAK